GAPHPIWRGHLPLRRRRPGGLRGGPDRLPGPARGGRPLPAVARPGPGRGQPHRGRPEHARPGGRDLRDPEARPQGAEGPAQTAASVSLSDILGALQSDVRSNLQTLLREYSSGLSHGGAQAFNQAARYFERAYRFTAITNDALLGEEPTRDIPRALRGSQRTF